MRCLLTTSSYMVGLNALLALVPSVLQAQFSVPLPQTAPSAKVRREDIQMLFVSEQKGHGLRDKKDSVRAQIESTRNREAIRSTWETRVKDFCEDNFAGSITECSQALNIDALSDRLGIRSDSEKSLTRTYFKGIPRRPALANYMQRSGTSDAFTFASQFSANISEKEAYVVSNIVRGLTGRSIFSADYAVVVTKSDEQNEAARDTVESDKANVLRAINNGGTLVGKFTLPFLARSGTTGTHAFGVTLSGGLIGPIAESDDSKRKGVLSGALEGLGALAIRSLNGDAEQKAELIYGARAGLTHAFGSVLSEPGHPNVPFGQFVIGLRQNGTITISGLVTLTSNEYEKLIPKLVLNFAAIH